MKHRTEKLRSIVPKKEKAKLRVNRINKKNLDGKDAKRRFFPEKTSWSSCVAFNNENIKTNCY